jgi:hypothetical protein
VEFEFVVVFLFCLVVAGHSNIIVTACLHCVLMIRADDFYLNLIASHALYVRRDNRSRSRLL